MTKGQNIKIPVTATNIGVEMVEVEVANINLSADDSGDWNIGVQVNLTVPDRAEVSGINLNENHGMRARMTVTRADIAAALSIEEAAVLQLPTEDLKNTVNGIALARVKAKLGIA
tara:strand:+ start:79 stop:423 length:345 start_codon:yes stop_codon:yes gene_type:complete